jgi:hypothetical protein
MAIRKRACSIRTAGLNLIFVAAICIANGELAHAAPSAGCTATNGRALDYARPVYASAAAVTGFVTGDHITATWVFNQSGNLLLRIYGPFIQQGIATSRYTLASTTVNGVTSATLTYAVTGSNDTTIGISDSGDSATVLSATATCSGVQPH